MDLEADGVLEHGLNVLLGRARARTRGVQDKGHIRDEGQDAAGYVSCKRVTLGS